MKAAPAFCGFVGAKRSAFDPEAQAGTPMAVRRVADLFPHPVIAKHAPGPSAHELSTLSERGEAAFSDPVTITHEDLIVHGYALWHLARLQNRATLSCIVRAMDRESALLHLLRGSSGTRGINDFVRIQMALELEPWFRERAKSNQRFGGRAKGSAHLPEADRLDVRIEVARAAGVSTGNVSKVKRIVHSAIPAVQDAVLSGHIQIHRAASWARESPSIQARCLDGVMAIILPHGVLFRGGAESRIRTKLLEDGMIDTVIGLPANLFYSTGIPVCVLVLKKCKRHDDVLFINAAGPESFQKGKRQNVLLEEHIAKIVDTYRERKEEPRYSRRVGMADIRKNEMNLNISRYVRTAEAEAEIDLAQVHAELVAIEAKIKAAASKHNEFLVELGLPPLP